MTPHFARAALLFAGLMAAAASDAAILTVTNGADSGAGSLRQAILDAASGDTIGFARDAGHASGYGNDQRGVPRPTDLAGVINATGGDGSDIGAFEEGVLSLDVDGNGVYDPLTDGVLILRYLSGFTGTALTSGAIGTSAVRYTPAQITTYLDSIKPALDVDGNGKIDALTDGLLLVRYLTGARGAALATGALGVSPARTSTQIDNYLQALVP